MLAEVEHRAGESVGDDEGDRQLRLDVGHLLAGKPRSRRKRTASRAAASGSAATRPMLEEAPPSFALPSGGGRLMIVPSHMTDRLMPLLSNWNRSLIPCLSISATISPSTTSIQIGTNMACIPLSGEPSFRPLYGTGAPLMR
jgi:hypothetical protein